LRFARESGYKVHPLPQSIRQFAGNAEGAIRLKAWRRASLLHTPTSAPDAPLQLGNFFQDRGFHSACVHRGQRLPPSDGVKPERESVFAPNERQSLIHQTPVQTTVLAGAENSVQHGKSGLIRGAGGRHFVRDQY
jgi:hypothetical protein